MHRHAKSCLFRYMVHQISLEKHLRWPSTCGSNMLPVYVISAAAMEISSMQV